MELVGGWFSINGATPYSFNKYYMLVNKTKQLDYYQRPVAKGFDEKSCFVSFRCVQQFSFVNCTGH